MRSLLYFERSMPKRSTLIFMAGLSGHFRIFFVGSAISTSIDAPAVGEDDQ